MGKVQHTVTGCVPVDRSALEAYLALIITNKNVNDAEQARVEAEESRVLAENARVNAEASRVDVESSRVNAEAARALAENARVEAETARETQAGADHTRAEGDHEVAVDDHTQAGEDHAASSEATDRANEAAAAAEHMVDIKQGPKGDQGNTGSSVDYPYELVNNVTTDDATKGLSAAQGVVLDGKISQLGQQVIYDVSANNGGATFASLSALLSDENLSILIPIAVRCGGMSIRFVQSSDNKYVQFRLTTNTFSTNTKEWQGVCDSFPFLDMDYIAPISNGYHTPATARVAVPEIYRKYGLVIQYRISLSEIRVEQFIDDSLGYNLNDNCWNTISPNNKKQPFTSLRELIYSGYKVNIETGVSSSDSAYDMTRPISVIPGRTYYCENLIHSVAYYGADLNWANATSRTRCFISGDAVNGHSITVPNNCYYVVINFKRQQLFAYDYVHLIDDKSFVNKLTNIDEPLSKTALPVQPFIQLNMACSLSDGSINDNNNYACCILPIKSFTSYVIRCRYNQDSGLRIVLWYSDFPSTDSFMDYVAVTNESQIFNAPQGAKWVGLTFTNRSFDSFHDTCWLEATDVNPCVIRRSGPSFTEYRFNNAPDNSRVSVGMLGTTEANLSYNMDYRTGVHKAYDPANGAMWLALNGANYAFQYAPKNMSTEGDVWENGGKQLALWGNVNQLAACIDSDDAKGTACIFGKRKVQESATFAGFNDCIIEGDRVKGASAPVYINRYNNGKVSIVAGGGNALVGTETDDTINKLQVNGSAKASQFRLSSLNTAPSSASDTGTAGEIRVTSDYIYVCIAANTWVRSALESW